MRTNGRLPTRRALLIAVTVALLSALVVPASAGAATYRFRVYLEARKSVSWSQTFRDDHCHNPAGDFYVHNGSGGGRLWSRLWGGQVTFRTVRGALVSSLVQARRATLHGHGSWTVAFQDDPRYDCVPPQSLGTPANSGPPCGRTLQGTLAAGLVVRGGRLLLAGAFQPVPLTALCPDPTTGAGLLGKALSSRRDVNRLIPNTSVSSITLRAFQA
jgi:hypothetical protein